MLPSFSRFGDNLVAVGISQPAADIVLRIDRVEDYNAVARETLRCAVLVEIDWLPQFGLGDVEEEPKQPVFKRCCRPLGVL